MKATTEYLLDAYEEDVDDESDFGTEFDSNDEEETRLMK